MGMTSLMRVKWNAARTPLLGKNRANSYSYKVMIEFSNSYAN
jgi:hypothetical protein